MGVAKVTILARCLTVVEEGSYSTAMFTKRLLHMLVAVAVSMSSLVGFSSSAEASENPVSTVTGAIQSGDFVVHAPEGSLVPAEAIEQEIDGITYVTIPLQNMHTGSNVTVALEGSEIVATSETHLKEVSDDSGHAAIWRDGEKVVDDVFSGDDTAVQTFGFSGKKLNDCLSGAGVASWIVAATGVSCGVPEVATKIACIIGLGVTAGTASYCVRRAFS